MYRANEPQRDGYTRWLRARQSQRRHGLLQSSPAQDERDRQQMAARQRRQYAEWAKGRPLLRNGRPDRFESPKRNCSFGVDWASLGLDPNSAEVFAPAVPTWQTAHGLVKSSAADGHQIWVPVPTSKGILVLIGDRAELSSLPSQIRASLEDLVRSPHAYGIVNGVERYDVNGMRMHGSHVRR